MAEKEFNRTPLPERVGEDGSQREVSKTEETALVKSELSEVLEKSPICKAISGLASSQQRFMGGETGAQLLAASVYQLTLDMNQIKKDLGISNKQNKELSEDNTILKTKVAVLTERVKNESKLRNLKNFSIFAGTTLCGVAIKLLDKELNGIAGILALLGLIFLLLGWFSNPKGERE